MNSKELMQKLEDILDEVKVGVLATSDEDGTPRMRWMSPVILNEQPNIIYTVTSPEFRKTVHLEKHPDAEWMIQSRDIREVINLRGKINLIDNPALKSQLMEKIKDRLGVFWKQSAAATDLLFLKPFWKKRYTFYR